MPFFKYKFDPKSFINCIIILFYLLLHLSVGMDILNYICHGEADLDVPLEFQLEHLMITTHLSSIIGNWSSKLHYARPACRECTCDAHGCNVVLALAMVVSDVAENNKNNFYDSVVYNNKKLPILFNCSFFVCTWFSLKTFNNRCGCIRFIYLLFTQPCCFNLMNVVTIVQLSERSCQICFRVIH